MAEEDSPLERCGLRTGGERIVLGEDNIPTEEEKGTSQDLLVGEDRPPSL